jgi:TolB protein
MYTHNRRLWKLLAVALIISAVFVGCSSDKKSTPTPTEEVASTLHLPLAESPLEPQGALNSPLPSSSDGRWPAGRVLYHSDQTGLPQIYLVENGGPSQVLTGPPGSAAEPAWSSDRQKVAFAAYTSDPTNIQIFVMAPDGSDRENLTPDQPRLNWRPHWSPDDTQLLFQSNQDGNFEIYKVNADGSGLTNLTNHPSNDGDADWSPDGGSVLFVSDRSGRNGLYVMDPVGSNAIELLDETWDCSYPRWSPDGEWIAFTSKQDGTQDIYVMRADGSELREVTERPGDNVMPAWVEGDRLLFSGEIGDDSWDLFMINVDGTGLVQLTRTPDSERFPVWAP